MLFVTTIKRAVRCPQETQYTAWLCCDKRIIEHTHDESCDMLLNLGACNILPGNLLMHGKAHFILVDVIQSWVLICYMAG